MEKKEKDINEKVDEVLKNYKPKEKIDNFALKKALSIAFIGIILISVISLYQTGWIKDTDGDGIFDIDDDFPENPLESKDTDYDGVGDYLDKFPYDSTQTTDIDSDGYGDNLYGNYPDRFPEDPFEWMDSDEDGIGDNADIYDLGNGGIKISITNYEGDEIEEVKNIDPFFIIKFWYSNKIGDDFVLDSEETSSVFYDKKEIMNPFSATFDVADDIYSTKIFIESKSYSSYNHNKSIDINGESISNFSIIDYFYPKESPNPQWNIVNGNLDDVDEYDAVVHYKIEIVGI